MKRYWIKRKSGDEATETIAGPFYHENEVAMACDVLKQETGRPMSYVIHPPITTE